MKLYPLVGMIIALRLFAVYLVQTYFVPDEYWQSLEVAHRMVFGYGYLSWEWVSGIRPYIYPLCIAGIYKLLAVCGWDTAGRLVLLPRVAKALLSAFADYRFFVWLGRKKWAYFLILINWFWFYISTRSLTNTVETALTTIALSYYLWYSREKFGYLWLVTLVCFLRPTAVLIWFPLCFYHLLRSRLSTFNLIFNRVLPIGLLVGGILVLQLIAISIARGFKIN